MTGKYQAYPEYKDSGVDWLGDTPSHWEAKQLKFLCTYNDEVLADSVSDEYEIKYVDIGSVSASEGIVKAESIVFGKAPSRARRIVRDGDVIVSTVRTYLEAIAPIDKPPENLIVSTGFVVIRPNKHLYKGYAAYCLRANGFIKEVVAQSVGISYPAINASDLVNIKVSEPKYDEQIKIASFLDYETAKIDTLIEKQQQLIKLLKEKRQAVISHAVTKGLNPNAPMRDSGVEWLGEVPEHWSLARVKFYCSVKGRIGFRGYTVDDLVDKEDGALVIGASEMKANGDIVLDSPKYISWEKYFESPEIMLEEGMILVVQRGTVGKIASIPAGLGQATINPSLIVLRDLDIRSKFMTYSLMSSLIQSLVDMERSSTAVPMISQEQVGNYWQLVPPEHEQQGIEEYIEERIDGIDNAINASNKSILLMQERRTALISAAVTGKIDVRNWQPPKHFNNINNKEVAA